MRTEPLPRNRMASRGVGAVAADGKKVGWGQADSEEEAQEKALKSCRKARGKNCQVQVSHCSF